jgi:heme/copper-type cytochrome/quinol oxidase subunit 2
VRTSVRPAPPVGLPRPAAGRWLAVSVVALLATALPANLVSAPQRTTTTQDDRRREVAVTVTDGAFEPVRIDARVNDIVAVTLTAGDTPHGFSLDAYRIAKRVEPGKPLRFEFRADTVGTFPFYCSLTGADGRPHEERGQLIVRR